MQRGVETADIDAELGAADGPAFLIVTPLGLGRAEELADALAARRIRVAERRSIDPWSRAATRLYLRSSSSAARTRALRFELQWRRMYPADRAEQWTLATRGDYLRLVERKAELRLRFRGMPLVAHPGEPAFSLHAFHVPDPCHLAAETQRLAPYRAAA